MSTGRPISPTPKRSSLAAPLGGRRERGLPARPFERHPSRTPASAEPALASGAAVVVGLAPEWAVRAAAASTRRTWWRFADGRFSGANLFLLRGEAARPALAFWRRVEAERKRPWRIVRLFGLGNLLLYVTGRLTLSRAMARASRRLGCTVAAVPIPIGEAAIDVDRPADLAHAEAILAGRAARRPP